MPPLDLSLYLVTDRTLCGARGVAETARRAVDGGATIVQLRDKRASRDELLREAESIAEAVAGRAAFVVNDRLDVALAARERGIPVDGVHLGQSDAGVLAAREALGPAAIVGLSASLDAQLATVLALPEGTVDYFGVGPIRATQTKPDHAAPIGVAGFERFARRSPLPCVAIGDVKASDAPALRAAGAAGLAAVSALCAAVDPAAAARELTEAWAAAGMRAAPRSDTGGGPLPGDGAAPLPGDGAATDARAGAPGERREASEPEGARRP